MTDYFSLLNLPPVFDLDLNSLEKNYFAAQRAFHPDRFTDKVERIKALQRSADINQAYIILKNSLTRARHLLSFHSIVVGTEKDSIKPSPELLMEVMEWREQAQEGKDITANITQAYNESLHKLHDFFAASDWNAMAQETLRLGYIEKIRQESPLRKIL